MAVSLDFQDVVKTFDGTRAVAGVSLYIEPGELFFLLGPSGCGKTTLLRCLAGFYEPDSGTIRIGDRDVTGLPPHERDTGMVFQSYALWPHLTIHDNVAFGLEMRRLPRVEIERRVSEALALVRMGDRARDKPNQLSGGQQQRVALARALVVRPQCLLLDEPLSNLDAKLRLEMRVEIRRICKEAGLTAIYVTHDQKEALSIADRLAIMDAGRIQQVGAPQDVYARPATRFVANFVGETNFVDGVVAEAAPGRVRVHTALGEFLSTVPAAATMPNGMKVALSIRPEAIRLTPPTADAPNVFGGATHDTMYLGEMAQHRLRLDVPQGGEEHDWKVFDLNPRIIAREKAEATRIWIAPEDVVVLRA